ncbi:MAG: porin family protein [Lacibacter sp.]
MKKAMICLFVLSLSFISRSQPSVSVKAGLNLHCQTHLQDATTDSWDIDFVDFNSPYRVKTVKNVKFIPGFNAGVNVTVPVTSNLTFMPGIDFNVKGGKAEGTYGSGNQSFPFWGKFMFTYIDIPLVMQYWLTKQFYLELGPDVGFMITANYQDNDNGTPYEDKSKDIYNKTEFSMTGGGGYVFKGTGFGVFARYLHGLTKVNADESYYSKVRNSTGQFGFFYRIKK